MALAAKGDIVVFEHYERCQPAFLTVLSNLVQRGKSPLAGRYVLQNGRLVDAGNALVTDAVGALTPRGKYLVLLSEAPVAKLADSFGAPFVSALGDICETAALTPESLSAVAKAEFDKLAARAQKALGFTVTAGDAALLLLPKAADAPRARRACWHSGTAAYRALAQYRLEHDDAPKAAALGAADGRLTADFGAGPADLLSLLPEAYQGEVEAVKAELDGIVGLAAVKEYVLSLEDNFAVQARRKAAGLKTASVSMHMIFTGNPGTGKTNHCPVGEPLPEGHRGAERRATGGSDTRRPCGPLCGPHRTAHHTGAQIRRGRRAVHRRSIQPVPRKRRQLRAGGIDTLVKGMEDHRDDLIVILAGYSKEMAEFLTANSGLKSRFPNIIEFPDYTGEELLAIAKLQAGGKGYTLDERCDANLLAYFNAVQLTRARDAGNGRLAATKWRRPILNQSRRHCGPARSRPVPAAARGFPVGRCGRSINSLPQVCLRFYRYLDKQRRCSLCENIRLFFFAIRPGGSCNADPSHQGRLS